jgi:CubicO group peptidase (beta-lactamase class C family)
MKRLLGISLVVVLVAVRGHAALTSAPNCPAPPPALPLPAACNVSTGPLTDEQRWAHAVACANALVATYPDYLPGLVMGYQKDIHNVPRLYATGSGDTGFEGNQVDRIVSLASVTKPVMYTAALKMIQDHMNSPDCALLPDGSRKSTCIFPNGIESRLNIALLRLDIRNGTNVHPTWFNNDYLGLADTTEMDSWKHSDLRIKHLFTMTSGFPDMTFIGHKFCDGPNCAEADEVVCPTNATSGECYYSRLWNNYLVNRGTLAPLPESCKPRPASGARLFDFVNYYGGQVYNATRLAEGYERRVVGEPGITNECILSISLNGAQSWRNGRQTTIADQARFYLGAPLQHRPGTGHRYNQPSVILVAYLIEAVTGIPFNAYVKREILTPLGMTDTFYITNQAQSWYAPGGDLHHVVHGSTNPNDHSNDEGGTPAQVARMTDLKRVPRRNWVVPTIAPPIYPLHVLGPDVNWDENRSGWRNGWPEGGLSSTASDMLKFLKFAKTGKTPGGQTLLDATYLALATSAVDPVSKRTFAFVTNPAAPDAISGNGAWATFMRRDKAAGVNYVVFPQVVTELPNSAPYNAPNCELHYGGVLTLRGGITRILDSIGDPVMP